MCDDSLYFRRISRPARVGDKLVSTRFQGFVTCGFAVIGKTEASLFACCLGPNLRLSETWNAMEHSASFAVAVSNRRSRAFVRSI